MNWALIVAVLAIVISIASLLYNWRHSESLFRRTEYPAVAWHLPKVAKEGNTASMIGLILRDAYGIPDVKTITKKSISLILKEKKISKELPEDLMALMKKNIKERAHLESNHKDMVAKRGLQLTEAKIMRLIKYYKKSGKLRRVTVSSAVPVKKATLTEKGRKRSSASTPLKRKLLENIRTIKPAPRATPPKPFVAWLTITSKQKGIWVRVDKNKPQRTPIRNIKIRSPKVRLRAWKRGYRSKTKVIKLSRGERKHLPITLRRLKLKPCTLNVVVLDAKGVVPANVHIGGKTFQAPFGNKKFRAGVYKIRVAWPGYMEYQGRITCRSGKPIRQTVRIRKK